MKSLPIDINEYIIKNKLDKPIYLEDHYDYFPETKEELIDNIKELFHFPGDRQSVALKPV